MKRFGALLLAGWWGLAPLACRGGECPQAVIAVRPAAVLPEVVLPRLAVRQVALRRAARKVVVRGRLLHAEAGLAVVPFAVPVAVPVAVVQQPAVFYGYSAYGSFVHAGAPRLPRLETPAGHVPPAPAARPGAVARACAACHGGAEPPGGLSLADLSALSPGQRLEAIARVLSDDPQRRMPKGAALSPAEAAQVLSELASGLAGATARQAGEEGVE